MKFTANNQTNADHSCDCLVEFVNKNGMNLVQKKQPKAIQESIAKLRDNGDLTDNLNPRMVHPSGDCKAKRILIVPVEFESSKTGFSHPHAAGNHIASLAQTIMNGISGYPIEHLLIPFDHRFMHDNADISSNPQLDAEIFASAMMNAAYSSNEFKGKVAQKNDKQKEKHHPSLSKVTILTSEKQLEAVQAGLKSGQAIGNGMSLARQLGDAPPNLCNPQYFTAQAKKLAKKYTQITTKVLGEKELKSLGAGAFLAVTQGSANPPQLILMEYKGGKSGQAPIALVGKGLTFDSGGISLKPGASMDEMKYDMCGAASVFGALEAAAALKLPINIIGAIAAAENMPSDKAARPGDIVTTMSGQTVEILNTDAEGRLVLCDTLTYIQRYKPCAIIDLATLTGACIVALGHYTTAIMSNCDSMSRELQDLSMYVNDPCWPLPLWPEYAADLKSNFADIPNISAGKGAGTIMAGAFLQKFVDAQTPWAHLDIAGVAWKSGASKGATGRPVHLLVSYLMKQAFNPTYNTQSTEKTQHPKSSIKKPRSKVIKKIK